MALITLERHCGDGAEHEAHERTTGWLAARWCIGTRQEVCADPVVHGPHWTDEPRGWLCTGIALGAICRHGRQMLNQCDDCEAT